MAVVIRLKRGGRTHAPYYRLVVMDSRDRNRGREVEQIGVYHPCGRPEPQAEVDVKRALEWLYRGAKYSDTARTILSDKGVLKAYADGVKPEDVADAAPAQESPAESKSPVETPQPVSAAAETVAGMAEPEPTTDEATVEAPSSGE